MTAKYCVDCEHLQKRPIMAEAVMDSGEYIQTGWRYVCGICGRSFYANDRDIEYQHCVCGEFQKKGKDNEID